MIFTDPVFLFAVLPIVYILFYVSSAKLGKTASLLVILIGSIAVYVPWGVRNLVLLLASVVVNYVCVSIILSRPIEHRATRRAALIIGELYNLLSLLWFKYTIVRSLFGSFANGWSDAANIAIPIGISFYTFQQASVLADAYNDEPRVKAFLSHIGTLRSRVGAFVRYAFFVTFFPHMIIGPIAYVYEIQPQIASPRFGRFSVTDLNVGLMLIGIGMFKKLVLADNLAELVDPIFAQASAGTPINAMGAWVGVLAYYTQLYFDFSGYSDMALGLARLFGITFPINFFSPLKAVGIVDYYRRWHMTLTRVISRFMFSPLSLFGTRLAAKYRLPPMMGRAFGVWIPLVINFLVIGLWHGSAPTFIVFGLVHGIWYALETDIRSQKWWRKWKKRTPPGRRRLLGRMLFPIPMAITFAIFRSTSVPAFYHLLHEMFRFDFGVPRSVPIAYSGIMLSIAFAVVYLLPNAVELMRRYRPGIMTYDNESYGLAIRWRPTWRWAIFWLLLVLGSLYYVSRQPPFLYMGF